MATSFVEQFFEANVQQQQHQPEHHQFLLAPLGLPGNNTGPSGLFYSNNNYGHYFTDPAPPQQNQLAKNSFSENQSLDQKPTTTKQDKRTMEDTSQPDNHSYITDLSQISNPEYRAIIAAAPTPRRKRPRRSITPTSLAASDGSESSAGTKRGKRKLQTTEELQQQRSLANVRERDRTRQLNEAFTALRRVVPERPCDKMSKIQTLKLACGYIVHLWELLQNDNYKEFPRSTGYFNAFSAFRADGAYRFGYP